MPVTRPPRILIFDSGVGGLSIYHQIQQRLPQCQLIFASDNKGFPYGTKSVQTLIARVQQVMLSLVDKTRPDIVVIACNSASTVVLPSLRQQLSVPVVGVVPAIKPAAQVSQTKQIGLLATPGTVTRHYTKQLVADFAADCEWVPVGSAELVQLAEQKLRGNPVCQQQLSDILEPFFNGGRNVDTIVLACTHFPLLKDEMASVSPKPIHWVDSGAAIARRVQQLLGDSLSQQGKSLIGQSTPLPVNRALFTAPCNKLQALHPSLKNYGCDQIEVINA